MLMIEQYRDRFHAGQILASELLHYANRPHVVVLALPRGGVPVGYEVARALRASFDVFLVRKLGLPGHPEFAMGAIASGGVEVLNTNAISQWGVSKLEIASVADREQAELSRREERYRGGKSAAKIAGQTVILVDDGLATGFSMRAAIVALHQQRYARLVVAVPVGAPETCNELLSHIDELVCPLRPDHFGAVSQWYGNFAQVTDDEVCRLLEDAAVGGAMPPNTPRPLF